MTPYVKICAMHSSPGSSRIREVLLMERTRLSLPQKPLATTCLLTFRCQRVWHRHACSSVMQLYSVMLMPSVLDSNLVLNMLNHKSVSRENGNGGVFIVCGKLIDVFLLTLKTGWSRISARTKRLSSKSWKKNCWKGS